LFVFGLPSLLMPVSCIYRLWLTIKGFSMAIFDMYIIFKAFEVIAQCSKLIPKLVIIRSICDLIPVSKIKVSRKQQRKIYRF
jgi:hypothetical protein